MVKRTNGIGVLTCIVLMASTSLLLAQPADDGSQDYGWQLNDGVLEYIIQVRPSQLVQMQGANPMEKESVMPIELVGRVRRVAVRVGNARLPRTPSLEEIERTIPRFSNANDVISALGPGRISNVEPGAVVNVQDNGAPSLPPGMNPFPGADRSSNNLADQAAAAQGSLIERANELARGNANAGQDFLNGAGGNRNTLPPMPSTTQSGAGGISNTLPPVPSTTQSQATFPGTNKYADTAPPIRNNGARGAAPELQSSATNAQGNRIPSENGWQGTADPPSRLADQRGQYDPRGGSALDGRGAFPSIAPSRGSGPAGFGANGYTDYPSSNAGDPRLASNDAARGGAAGGYGNDNLQNNWPPGYQNTKPQGPNSFPSTPPLVSNQQPPATSQQPPATSSSAPGQSASDKAAGDGSTTAAAGATETGTASSVRKTSDVLMQMFFLVSLVANVYLVFLIRKLLTRYRSLLSTVRSQTA